MRSDVCIYRRIINVLTISWRNRYSSTFKLDFIFSMRSTAPSISIFPYIKENRWTNWQIKKKEFLFSLLQIPQELFSRNKNLGTTPSEDGKVVERKNPSCRIKSGRILQVEIGPRVTLATWYSTLRALMQALARREACVGSHPSEIHRAKLQRANINRLWSSSPRPTPALFAGFYSRVGAGYTDGQLNQTLLYIAGVARL